MNNIEEIIAKIKNNKYEIKLSYPKRPEGYKKENYVYNENKSVKWNREHRLELEENYKNELTKYVESSNQKELEFKQDVINYIINTTDFTKEQAKLIFKRAWVNEHSEGYENVAWEVEDLKNWVLEIINKGVE